MKFAVIIPIYNTQEYIEESISSVINQTLPFENNIYLILINDGSTDSSEDICMRFKKMYPDNIIYCKTENLGPSSARNIGLRLLPKDSVYVTFLDSDDKLELNAFKAINQFFLKHPNVNIASLQVNYFDKLQGSNRLNKRFKNGSRVIDIDEEYYSPHYYIGGVILNIKLLHIHDIVFNQDLNFWEDALFVNQLIISEKKYGVIAGTSYWYRKRDSEDSLVDLSWNNKSRYTDLITNGYQVLIDFSKKKHGFLLPYTQYLIVYHLKLFVFQKNSKKLELVLNNTEKLEFINKIKALLYQIDEKYILEQNTRNTHKEILLFLKTGKKVITGDSILEVNQNKAIKITSTKLSGFNIIITGYFADDNYFMKKKDRIFAKTPLGVKYTKKVDPNKQLKVWGFVVRDYKYSGFEIKIPLWVPWFYFGIETENKQVLLQKINILKAISNRLKKRINSYN